MPVAPGAAFLPVSCYSKRFFDEGIEVGFTGLSVDMVKSNDTVKGYVTKDPIFTGRMIRDAIRATKVIEQWAKDNLLTRPGEKEARCRPGGVHVHIIWGSMERENPGSSWLRALEVPTTDDVTAGTVRRPGLELAEPRAPVTPRRDAQPEAP